MRERPDKLNNHAIMLASDGEYTEAIACFKRAIVIERNNYLLWYNLGITYRDSGDLSSARSSLEKAHQIAPEKADVLETLSTLCIQMEDYVDSLGYTKEGLEKWPENPAFWNLSGVALFNMEKYEQASESFEQAVCLNPYYTDALYNLRDTYTQLNNHNGADECNKRIKNAL
ncbi:MAG: tetratricopeptide repeat protein [Treponema sp.]|nr:tetratricopeptide repeat protein [Treponema sp.]